MKPIHKKSNPAVRCCAICGKPGGSGSTTILRFLGYDVPEGEIGYAHIGCVKRERKRQG